MTEDRGHNLSKTIVQKSKMKFHHHKTRTKFQFPKKLSLKKNLYTFFDGQSGKYEITWNKQDNFDNYQFPTSVVLSNYPQARRPGLVPTCGPTIVEFTTLLATLNTAFQHCLCIFYQIHFCFTECVWNSAEPDVIRVFTL